jgi:hypothetical protein
MEPTTQLHTYRHRAGTRPERHVAKRLAT